MSRKNLIPFISLSLAFSACGISNKPYDLSAKNSGFLSTGTIVLSRQLPAESQEVSQEVFSPVLGYIPPMTGILPASNEMWIEIDTQALSVSLYHGNEIVKSFKAEGTVTIAPGKYALQYKQKYPTWYAPNSYFEKRALSVPAEQDRSRFMKGALGEYALYPTSGFIIHSAPFYSNDVGGLRVPEDELSAIFSQLQVGSSVVVK
jgi:hypothetical protein